MSDAKIFKITGKVQHYQWGGYSFLPQLLSMENKTQKPFAEYWLGAHQSAPAEFEDAPDSFLDEYIAGNPSLLGDQVKDNFGRLPYLLKVLDVKDMLSIQVHPTKSAAIEEFKERKRSRHRNRCAKPQL